MWNRAQGVLGEQALLLGRRVLYTDAQKPCMWRELQKAKIAHFEQLLAAKLLH